MGVFSSIKEKLFGKKATEPAKVAAAGAEQSVAPTMGQTALSGKAASLLGPAPAVASAVSAPAPAPEPEPVDIEAVLEAAVAAKGVKLNWRVSIVDLMKALDLDSSLSARKELAAELNYSGSDPDGSAEKNIWLHKELMKALAANGGKVPSELLN